MKTNIPKQVFGSSYKFVIRQKKIYLVQNLDPKQQGYAPCAENPSFLYYADISLLMCNLHLKLCIYKIPDNISEFVLNFFQWKQFFNLLFTQRSGFC